MTTAAATSTSPLPQSDKYFLRTRQHWHVVALPVLYTAVFVALAGFIWVKQSHSFAGRFVFAFVVMVLLAPWYAAAAKPFLSWFGTRYTIDGKREQVIVEVGIIRRDRNPAHLTEAVNTKAHQPLLCKMFGCGTIKVTQDITLVHLPNVIKVQNDLIDLVRDIKMPGVRASELARRLDLQASASAGLPATPEPSPIQVKLDRARALGEAGHRGEAIAMLGGVLDECDRTLGPDHPDTVHSRQLLTQLIGGHSAP
jgi:hypothetical protein